MSSTANPRSFAAGQGLLGALGVGLLAGVERATVLDLVLSFACLAVVPWGLSTLPSPLLLTGRWSVGLRILVPLAGLAVVVGRLQAEGVSTLWNLGWAAVTLVLAMTALRAAWRHRRSREPALWASIAACVFLPVGAAWLLLAGGAIPVPGVSPVLATLTAVHFHYAAFGAPLLAGRAVHVLGGRPRRVGVGAALAIVLGVPVTALGISTSPVISLVGACLMAAGLVTLAVLEIVWVVRRLRRASARLLLVASALGSLFSMPLALVYAWGELRVEETIGIPRMIELHGLTNAFVVVGCGLLAWAIEEGIPRAEVGSEEGAR